MGNIKTDKNKVYERVCLVCGSAFQTESYRVKICSDKCRKKRQQENKNFKNESIEKEKGIQKKKVCSSLDDFERERALYNAEREKLGLKPLTYGAYVLEKTKDDFDPLINVI